jgi:hypothetical protein
MYVVHARTAILEEHIASIIRDERISKLGTMLGASVASYC